MYTRLIRLRQKLDWSDYLLILSAIDAMALIICDTLTYRMGVLDEYETSVKLSKVRWPLDPQQQVTHRTLRFPLRLTTSTTSARPATNASPARAARRSRA